MATAADDRVAQVEMEIDALKAEVAKQEKALAAMEQESQRLPPDKLPELLHRKDSTQAKLDSAKAKLARKQSVADGLWNTFFKNEGEPRRTVPTLQIEITQAETSAAISRLAAKLDVDPDLKAIIGGLNDLRHFRMMYMDQWPIPPAGVVAQVAYRECLEQFVPVAERLQALLREADAPSST